MPVGSIRQGPDPSLSACILRIGNSVHNRVISYFDRSAQPPAPPAQLPIMVPSGRLGRGSGWFSHNG